MAKPAPKTAKPARAPAHSPRTLPPDAAHRVGTAIFAAFLALYPFVHFIWTYDQYELPKFLFMQVLLAACLPFLALVVAQHGGLRRILPAPLLLPTGLWLAFTALSTAASSQFWIGLRGEYESWCGLHTQLCLAAVMVATYHFSAYTPHRTLIVHGIAAGGAAALIGAVLNLNGITLANLMGWVTTRVDPMRVGGTLGNPNFLAAHLVVVLPVFTYFALTARDWRRWAGLGAAALAQFIIFRTGSRIGVTTFEILVAALGAYALWDYSRGQMRALATPKYLVLAAAAVVTVAGISALASKPQFDRIIDSIQNPGRSFNDSRRELWVPGLQMAADNPWLGTGPDGYKVALPRYVRYRIKELLGPGVAPLHAENEFIDIAGNTGLPALFAYLWMIAVAVWMLWAVWRRGRPAPPPPSATLPDTSGPGLATFAFCAATAILGRCLAVSFGFGTMAPNAVFFALFGLAARVHAESVEAATAPVHIPPSHRRNIWIVTGAAALIMLHGAWTHLRADMAFFQGYIEFTNGRPATAAAYFDVATTMEPHIGKYRFNLAQATEEMSRQRPQDPSWCVKARDAYRALVAQQPDFAFGLSGYGRTLMTCPGAAGDSALGLEYLRLGARAAPNENLLQQSHIVYAASAHLWDDVLATARILGAYEPTTAARVLIDAGKRAIEDGADLAHAKQMFELALALQPESHEARHNLGVYHVHRQEWDLAVAAFRAVLAKKPDFVLSQSALEAVSALRAQAASPAGQAVTSATQSSPPAP